ncbi:hypothetical protein U9M48_035818 [Paspalum notatum var. saurae]|uniref:Uncharacterized protein n=1 Tax=Paspalum notatum var. saurae TaxID=547442 RepID=A0AAQ3UFW7_PASNO
MDWRPSDGLEVDDEVLDGLRQKSSNGLEAMLSVGWPWKLGTQSGDWQQWCKPSNGLRGDSDGLEKPGATMVLQPECMVRRRAREALAALAQNRHPSSNDLVGWAPTRQDRRLGQDSAQEAPAE